MLDFLHNNWLQLLTTVGIVIGWLVDKQVRKSTAKQTEADAMSGMQEVYDKFVADVQERISDLSMQVSHLQQKLDEANFEREILLKKIADFEVNAEKDKILIKELKKKIDSYQRELQSYKKSLK